MNEQVQERLDAQEATNMRSTAQQMGLRVGAEQTQHTVHNEDFLNELRKADLTPEDAEFDADLEQQFPHWFAGPHSVTNRGDNWGRQADLIMQNKRERAVAERRPGRLLRDRPFMLAVMQGAESPREDAYQMDGIPGSPGYWQHKLAEEDPTTTTKPITSEQMSLVYGAAEVSADLMTLSRNAAGLESVSTVKTETNVRKEREEETTKEKAGRFLR